MRATFLRTNKSGAYTYSVTGTPEEMKAYEKAKGSYFRKDDTTGDTLYFTSRPLSSDVEYKLDAGGYLTSDKSDATQGILNKLADVAAFSLNDLQKYAAMKQAGLI